MTIRVIVAVDVEFEAQLVGTLTEMEDVTVQSRPADDTELLAAVVAGVGDVVILGQYFTGADRECTRRILGNGGRVLGFGEAGSAIADWGVHDLISPWASEGELAAALRRVVAADLTPPKPQHAPATPHAHEGTVIAVWGTGSAPGRSTIASSLAYTISRSTSCLLIDADTVNSTQAALLGLLHDTPQIVALCRASDHLSRDVIESAVSVINPHFHVVTGLSRATRWPEIQPAHLTEVLNTLRRHYPVIVVDLADRIDPDDDFADPHYDRHSATRVTLDCADHVISVTTADPMGLKRLVSLLETDRAHTMANKTTVVVNRVRASAVGQRPEDTITATLERFAHVGDPVFVPEAQRDVDRAVLAGRTVTEVVPRSSFSVAIDALLDRLPVQTAPRRRDASRKQKRKRKMSV